MGPADPAPETDDGPDLSDTNPQNEEPGPSADADPGPAVAATPKPAAQPTRPAPKVTAPADAPRDAKKTPVAVPVGATQAPADEKGTPADPSADVGPAAEKDATGGLARTGR